MKIAVVGSRDFNNYDLLKKELSNFSDIECIISGGARGADTLAKQYCIEKSIKMQEFLPEYNKYPSRVAPIKRNDTIVENCDMLIAFWNYKSAGTKYTIEKAQKMKKNIYIVRID